VLEKFVTEVAACKPDLLIWFDDIGLSAWNDAGQRLARLGIRILVLVPTEDILRFSRPDGEYAVPRHVLPMPKGRLIKVIEDILEGR